MAANYNTVAPAVGGTYNDISRCATAGARAGVGVRGACPRCLVEWILLIPLSSIISSYVILIDISNASISISQPYNNKHWLSCQLNFELIIICSKLMVWMLAHRLNLQLCGQL